VQVRGENCLPLYGKILVIKKFTSSIVFGQEDADLKSDIDGRFNHQWVVVQHRLGVVINMRTLDPVAGVV
jgi:hypothetical protein